MTPGDPLRSPLARFAGEVAGLKPDLQEGETLAALFRKLRDDDFLPDPLAHEALLALAGRPVQSGWMLGEEAFAAEERKLHDEVEGFARAFFAMPVSSRGDRWRALARSCAPHPSLVDRLRALKRGLEVDRGAVNDPSPPVNRLLDDLLAIFPLQPTPRAVESRARLEQFRSDPSMTLADRDRARRHVLERYPAFAALSPGYLAQQGQPWPPIKPVRVKARKAGTWNLRFEENRAAYILLLVSVLGTVGRLANSGKPTNPSPPAPAKSSLPPSFRPSSPKVKPDPKSSITRDALFGEIKGKVDREITRIGKEIGEGQLLEVVGGLPVDELPVVGGMETIVRQGYWTDEVHARFVARLKAGLEATDLGLSGRELDELAKKCFPSPSQGPAPGRPQAP